jgi:mannose-6-phosphate isomerase-like protein (cupin superfamily)
MSDSSTIRPAKLFRTAAVDGPVFRQHLTPGEANLEFLNCGQYDLPEGSRMQALALPGHEALLFQWSGQSCVRIGATTYALAPYDVLYVPLGAEFTLANAGDQPSSIVQMSAPAQKSHPVFHSVFSEFSRREERIRRLKGKNVYLMFDVSEHADKLVAGYTFFEPHARSWPPHNHTDQEEIYFFIRGQGAMEVYAEPESLSFVHSVAEGDAVSIPYLNYHPVFSQAEPVEFIWCIAGERYWVGDKNKTFMSGGPDAITT